MTAGHYIYTDQAELFTSAALLLRSLGTPFRRHPLSFSPLASATYCRFVVVQMQLHRQVASLLQPANCCRRQGRNSRSLNEGIATPQKVSRQSLHFPFVVYILTYFTPRDFRQRGAPAGALLAPLAIGGAPPDINARLPALLLAPTAAQLQTSPRPMGAARGRVQRPLSRGADHVGAVAARRLCSTRPQVPGGARAAAPL